MDLLSSLLALAIPSIGAAFVWFVNTARKDHPLFHEMDRSFRRSKKLVVKFLIGVGIANLIIHPTKWLIIVLLLILVLAALHGLSASLPFFRRVAALPRTESTAVIGHIDPSKDHLT